MTVLHILAHFDDEYCAWPLIREAAREGLTQRFVYLADYRDEALRRRRLAETERFLAGVGIEPSNVRHLGAGLGGFDGQAHLAAGRLFDALQDEVRRIGPVTRLVVPAWEGGHMDHDACALMAVRLAARLDDPPIRQFTLYNGPGLPGPLLRGGAPLAENGPLVRLRLCPAEWLEWMAQVGRFPSQLYAWSGIWPAMFAGMARRGFGWQTLTPARVMERPHAGSLFYERMFKVPYAEVRSALDAALPALDPALSRPGRG